MTSTSDLVFIFREMTVALASAISLLERSPKTGAPSDKMFDLLLADYRRTLTAARAIKVEQVEAKPGGPK